MCELQQLAEASWIDPGIQDHLVARGYQYLGQGIDQMAFVTPGRNAVLKIFGTGTQYQYRTHRARPGQDLPMTTHQRMFVIWADYCIKHRNNPFLPKFGKAADGNSYTPFVFRGRLYFQMLQERLLESGRRGDVLAVYSDLVGDYSRPELHDYITGRSRPESDWRNRIIQDARRLMPDPNRLELLTNTMLDLYHMAQKNGWIWDLHSGNILMRRDGTPVLADPWHVES